MSKPQVTITLGRTGRRVVKSEQVQSDRSWNDSQPLSGGKRYTGERVRNGADGPFLPTNKRLRNGFGVYGPGYNRVHDARIGQNDLRLKLMRKRRQNEVEERKKMTLRDKVSRSVWSTKRDLSRHAFHTKRAGATLHGESSRKSHAFHNGAALKPRSPERVPRLPREILPPRQIDEPWQVPSRRPNDASRTGRILDRDASRTTGPMHVTTRAPYNVVKPVTAPPPDEKHHTVSALLHSLGLERYAIIFQAEEVDIVALKQMRDNDLKELGIPMGPRKKILLALLSCSRRQPF